MQTLTIRADETLISQIVAISKALANTTNQELIIDDGYADELNARADEALQGKGLIDEVQARKKLEAIKAEILSDVEAIRRGEFETISHDELKARIMRW